MTRHSGIKDSGARFQIVPSTRRITVPPACKTIGTVGDINSEQLTIECPKVIDGHDIKGCAEHYVTWRNANDEIGNDHLALIDESKESLFFTWTVRGETTTKAGIVSFSVHFADYSKSGKPVYHWGTAECSECEVLNTVNSAIGAYESVYVDDDTLVFADHTIVHDETILLQTPGIVPDGRKFINTNGIHDVAEFASVDVKVDVSGVKTIDSNGTHDVSVFASAEVKVPTVLEVLGNGIIRAQGVGTNDTELVSVHQLSTEDDPNFIAENIREGKTIFGKKGKYVGVREKTIHVVLTIGDMLYESLNYEKSVTVSYVVLDDGGFARTVDETIVIEKDTLHTVFEFDALAGTPVTVTVHVENLGVYLYALDAPPLQSFVWQFAPIVDSEADRHTALTWLPVADVYNLMAAINGLPR